MSFKERRARNIGNERYALHAMIIYKCRGNEVLERVMIAVSQRKGGNVRVEG